MSDCKECGKMLGILEGYRHPTYGKSHLLCSSCFDKVSESVQEWGDFVSSNSFNKTKTSSNSNIDLKSVISVFSRKHEDYKNFVKVPLVKKTQISR